VTQTPLTTALFGTQQFAMRLTPSPNQEVWSAVHKEGRSGVRKRSYSTNNKTKDHV
jgi:hypothetical protein